MELSREQLIEELKKAQEARDRLDALEKDNKALSEKIERLEDALKEKEEKDGDWLSDLLFKD